MDQTATVLVLVIVILIPIEFIPGMIVAKRLREDYHIAAKRNPPKGVPAGDGG